MKKKSIFTVEIPMRCSPTILYEFLSTSNGLQEWFADKVNQEGENFSFSWEGSTDEAMRIGFVDNESVKYRWDYYDEEEYFEFKISQSPVTNETLLVITDFAEENEIKDQQMLWESQVNDLKHRIGS